MSKSYKFMRERFLKISMIKRLHFWHLNKNIFWNCRKTFSDFAEILNQLFLTKYASLMTCEFWIYKMHIWIISKVQMVHVALFRYQNNFSWVQTCHEPFKKNSMPLYKLYFKLNKDLSKQYTQILSQILLYSFDKVGWTDRWCYENNLSVCCSDKAWHIDRTPDNPWKWSWHHVFLFKTIRNALGMGLYPFMSKKHKYSPQWNSPDSVSNPTRV